MSRELKVVHVITTLATGGAERQLEMVVRHSRHPSTVVVLYAAGPMADVLRAAGHRVVELRATGWRKLVAPLLLAHVLRRERAQVAHVHLLSGQLMGIPAARLARVPVVVSTEHSLMDSTIEGRRLTRPLLILHRGLAAMATRTVAVSETTAERLRRRGVSPLKLSVVGLGIDLEALAFDDADRRAVRAGLGLPESATVIGVVGRLAPVKRVDLALRALAPLLRHGAVLVVVGEGPLLDELKTLADELEVGSAVRWLGVLDRVGPVLSALDVLVSASADETFGMAVVEGLASGLPVAFAACPAIDELAQVPPGAVRVEPTGDDGVDVDLLGEAVTRALVLAPTTRTAPPAVVERYGAQAAADRLDVLYERLLARRRG